MSYVPKSARACHAVNDARYGRAIRIASQAFHGPEFVEADDGQRIRIWGDGMEDWVTPDDVRAWLKGNRVVELREGLEFVRENYITGTGRDQSPRKDRNGGGFYWITAKAAEKCDLDRVMGCEFPA